jgi:phosphatidate cytidylyltransferase
VTNSIRKYNNLTQRIITGVLGAAAIITGVSASSWSYFAVLFLILFLTLNEFYNVARVDSIEPDKTLGISSGILTFTICFLIQKNIIAYQYIFLIFPVVALMFILKLYRVEKKPFTNIAFTLLGFFYVALPLSLLNFAAFENGEYHYEIILGSLLILWATDTGAYFAGTFFGKRKLFERVSPKKTWEGFAGGALLAFGFAYGLSQYYDYLTITQWMLMGAIIIVGGTFGDLVESLLKRSISIKDSGKALPGHGGFLDRFDGLLISSPFLVAFLELL